jgi:hypothetical protein
MPKNGSNQIDQNYLDKGLKMIIYAFNEQKKEYSKKNNQLELEIQRLKEENNIYKNKLTILQQKLKILSKTVCSLDIEQEETKNQMEKKLTESKKIAIANNNIINKNRKNYSVDNKYALFNNFLSQNNNNLQNQEKTANQRAYSNNFQYDAKYIIDSPKHSFIKMEENLSNFFIKKKKNFFDDNSNTHSSYLKESIPKDIEINIGEESRTDRNFFKRNIFSEKNLEINKTTKNKTSHNIKELLYNNNNANEYNDINNIYKKKKGDNVYHKNRNEIYFKEMKISGDNNSKLYKKLNTFLEECKKKLNAMDYENVINLLKSFEIDSNVNIRKKVKKYLNNSHKLCILFDKIFEV